MSPAFLIFVIAYFRELLNFPVIPDMGIAMFICCH